MPKSLWRKTLKQDRKRVGDELIDRAIANSKEWCRNNGITTENQAWLEENGYCPWAAARGITGDTNIWLSRIRPRGPIYLRNHICHIDGHENSDLDPGTCLHCGLNADNQQA